MPYQGSKNKIAEWVIDNLPPGDILVDLFAGGCAITHASLVSGGYKKVIANDITDVPSFFMDAINGKFANEKRWISREDFFKLKDTELYVSLCWSFGNNRHNYMYSKEIEPWKKALHFARVYNDFSLFEQMKINTDGSNKDIIKNKDKYKEKYIEWFYSRFKNAPKNNVRIYELESLQRLQSLQSLQISQKSYGNLDIPNGAVVYADPPYRETNTKGYLKCFDWEAFDEWLEHTPFMVIISEYTAPRGCVEVANTTKINQFGNNHKTIERLFVQKRFYNQYCEMMKMKNLFYF